jgi:heme A synthase
MKNLKVVNLILFIDFSILAITGILNYRIPYEIYTVIHPLSGYILITLVIIHITLNRKWIKTSYFKKK